MGYEVAVEEFRDQTVTERESWILAMWMPTLESRLKRTRL